MKKIICLGIESSCDETSAAIVDSSRNILSHIIYSQIPEHQKFGGVVPELAARAHILAIDDVINSALRDAGMTIDDIDVIAATAGPGLIGGVIVGWLAATGIAQATGKPLVAINHLEAHALVPRLTNDVEFPYLLLLASGGHTQILLCKGVGKYELIGQTLDDSSGEAFDKVAKMLGLGYPGGPEVDARAKCGNTSRFKFPRPLCDRPGCDFSFSGIKTAARNFLSSCLVERCSPSPDSEAVDPSAREGLVDTDATVETDAREGLADTDAIVETGIKTVKTGIKTPTAREELIKDNVGNPALAAGSQSTNVMKCDAGAGKVNHRIQNENIKQLATNMRNNMTAQEKKFWYSINAKKLGFQFRRQFNIDNKYIADFVCLEKRLVIEIDGSRHYENKSDEIRTEYLQKLGFNVVRFWNWDVDKNLDACLQVVSDILNNDSFEKRLEKFNARFNPPPTAKLSTPPQGRGWSGPARKTIPQVKGVIGDCANLLSDKFINDFCASFQAAVVDCIINRLTNALGMKSVQAAAPKTLVVAGGVAKNSALRAALENLAAEYGMQYAAPPLNLCTDNGAMVAWAGIENYLIGNTAKGPVAPRPRWPLTEL